MPPAVPVSEVRTTAPILAGPRRGALGCALLVGALTIAAVAALPFEAATPAWAACLAFAATAAVVEDHHFDALFDAYLADEAVRGFLAERNPAALREVAQRFDEAIERGLWRPRRNSAPALLDELKRGETAR